jgi:molecular chaperone DnaK
MAGDNKSLGRFELMGIPPAPRGIPQVEVTFDIDANGILHVTAKDMGSGKEQAIKITAKSGLSEDDIKRMVKDAELHADEDKKKRESISQKNNLDNMVYQTEKLVRDNKDKLTDADTKPLQAAIDEAKKVLSTATSSADDMKAALDKLTAASHTVSGKLYEKSKASGGGGGGGESGGGGGGASGAGGAESSKTADGEDVIDADYKDVN